MSKPDGQPELEQLSEGAQEAVAALGDLGDGLAKLQQLNDEQFHEVVSLLETIGKDDAADALRTTRRDLLKTGATAAAGLGVGAAGVAGLTDRASAGSNQAGTIGTTSNPIDINAEDMFIKQQSGTPSTPSGFGAYVDDGGTPKHVDQNGNVTDLSGAGHLLRSADGSIDSYPATAAGVKDLFADAAARSVIQLAGGPFTLGTDTLTVPDRSVVRGSAMNRGTLLAWDAGVGTGMETNGGVALQDINLFGPFDATASDVGVRPATGSGFSRFSRVRLTGWCQGAYLDNHFNSHWNACHFGRGQGDESGAPGSGYLHLDVGSGSNNNTRIFSPYVSSMDSSLSSALNIEANEITVVGWQSESNNCANEVKVTFGSSHQIIGYRAQGFGGGEMMRLDDGPIDIGFVNAEHSSGGSSGAAFNAFGASAGDASVIEPTRLSGFNTDFKNFGTSSNVTRRDSN